MGIAGQRGLRDQRRVAALQEQPGGLEVADRELQAGQLRLVAAEVAAGPATSPRIAAAGGRRPRPRGRLGRPSAGRVAVSVGGPTGHVALEAAEVVVEGLPAGQVVEVGRAVAVADGAQRVRGERERLRGLGMQLVEPGARRLAPGSVHRAECSRRRRSTARAGRAGRPGRGVDPPGHAIRNTRTSVDRGGVRGIGGDGQQDLREAGRRGVRAVVQDRGPSPWSLLATISHWAPNSVGEVEDVRRRLVGEGERRHALRLGEPDREVVDHRVRCRRAARRSPPSARARTRVGARGVSAPGRRCRAAARPRTAPSAPTASTAPSHATGRVQPMRRPRRGEARVQRAQRRHDEQHVDGRRGVEERAPGRRDREQQARHEEGDQRRRAPRAAARGRGPATAAPGARSPTAGCPGTAGR